MNTDEFTRWVLRRDELGTLVTIAKRAEDPFMTDAERVMIERIYGRAYELGIEVPANYRLQRERKTT